MAANMGLPIMEDVTRTNMVHNIFLSTLHFAGTLRAHQMRPHFELADIEGRPPSPGLPPPPPQLSNYDYYGTINKNRNGILPYLLNLPISELPPPAAQLLNSTHEDDDLPPPPGGSYYSPPQTSSNYFDVRPDWVPSEGSYIEKGMFVKMFNI